MILFFAINVSAESCKTILGSDLYNTIKNDFLKPLKIIAPILLLVLTSLDFAKTIFNDNKDGMQKTWQRFLKRGIATLLVFFASNIVEFILGLVDIGLCGGF